MAGQSSGKNRGAARPARQIGGAPRRLPLPPAAGVRRSLRFGMSYPRVFFGLCVAVLLAGCARRPTKLEIFDVVINHVTIVDVRTGQLQPNQVVAIARGKIVEVAPADRDSYAARQYVNGNGRYLIPGLWDMHVHFRGGDSLAAAN